MAAESEFTPVVCRLGCLRGLATLTAPLRLERIAVTVLLIGPLRGGSCEHRRQRRPQIHR